MFAGGTGGETTSWIGTIEVVRMVEAFRALAEIAEEQWGLVLTAQARGAGVPSQQLGRLRRAGLVEQVRHGVWRLRGVPWDMHDELRAAFLVADPQRAVVDGVPSVVVSHEKAAALFELGDVPGDYLEFTVPSRRQSRDPDVRYHVGRVGRDEWATHHSGLPVTTPLRTVADLAAARADGSHLGSVARDAICRMLCPPGKVSAALDPHAAGYGRGSGAQLLGDLLVMVGVAESVFETVELFTAAQQGLVA